MLIKRKILLTLPAAITLLLIASCDLSPATGQEQQTNKFAPIEEAKNSSQWGESHTFTAELWPNRTLYYYDQNVTTPMHKMKLGFAMGALRYVSGLRTVRRSNYVTKTLQIRHVRNAAADVTRGNIPGAHMIIDFDKYNIVQIMKLLMKTLGFAPSSMDIPRSYDYSLVNYWYTHPDNRYYTNRLSFMAETYLIAHTDLSEKFGTNQQKAVAHWKKFGVRERPSRLSSLIMDVKYYKTRYGLRGHSDPEDRSQNIAYIANFLYGTLNNFTISNGARASRMFDPVWYMNRYPDLKQLFSGIMAGGLRPDYVLAAYHFVHHGLAEGRQSAADFDIKSYIQRYPALRNLYGAKDGRPANYVGAMNHYLRYGRFHNLNPAPL